MAERKRSKDGSRILRYWTGHGRGKRRVLLLLPTFVRHGLLCRSLLLLWRTFRQQPFRTHGVSASIRRSTAHR